ncbi:MAG: hypothetical protein CMJ18_12405 [Phycisphaeraceae bacterium]|nr:hypothetical protein [Phycisphaeraceae bacterium]
MPPSTTSAREALIDRLERKARFLRVNALALNNRTLHAGGALSSADLVAVLYYHVLRVDSANPQWEDRDVFINSRGHACEPVYVALADLGFFPWDDLHGIEDFGSHLHGLSATTTPGVEVSMGSLGTGISIATGMALSLRTQGRPGRVYVVTGDGELQEGLSWEGALSAGKYGVDNLVVIVDRNRYQSSDRGTETVMPLEPLEDKFRAFGFATCAIDGHDLGHIVDALDRVPLESGRPTCIIANTVKGKGVSFLESGHVHCGRFGRDYDAALLQRAIDELDVDPPLLRVDVRRSVDSVREIPLGSTTDVFSEKLNEWADRDRRVCYVGVDTMDPALQQKHPDRAFDVGIAEQSELALATGLSMQGMIPVIQAWAPFTPLRNFDQLRTYLCRHDCNAKIIGWALGLVNNSHGTTHHDLESIALYRVVPNLTVLTAFDDDQFRLAFDAAMSVDGPVVLLGQPEHYAPGADGLEKIALPPQDEFVIGRNQWARRGADITLVTYGPALRYAWAAADRLEAEGIGAGLINVTSIKPFDEGIIEEAAGAARALLVVEEQSVLGGIGSAVAEIIAERGLEVRFLRLGIPDCYVEDVGDWTHTRKSAGLSIEDVIRTARTMFEDG